MTPADLAELQRRITALEAENAKLKAHAATDVSRRKQAETALADSEERYRTLFNSMDEGFCIIETGGRWLEGVQAALKGRLAPQW